MINNDLRDIITGAVEKSVCGGKDTTAVRRVSMSGNVTSFTIKDRVSGESVVIYVKGMRRPRAIDRVVDKIIHGIG